MQVNPGKLDKRLTFQVKDEEAKSPDGDPIEGYKDSFTVWGSFIFLKEENILKQRQLIVKFRVKRKYDFAQCEC
ncbi:Phage head-tail adaptor [Bacillus thuringiensis serovar pakistani str. T13001]|nr:Phage head-tail adaptor [Bacillus thuringiensis serovar pakistani str. T13001]